VDATPQPYAAPPQDPTAPETDAKLSAERLAIFSFLLGLVSLLLCPFVGQAGAAALAFASQRKTKASGAGTLGLAKLGYGVAALGLVGWTAIGATHGDPPKRQDVALSASGRPSTTTTPSTERQAPATTATSTPAPPQPLLATAPPTTAAPAIVAAMTAPPSTALPPTTAPRPTAAPTTAKPTTTIGPTTTAVTAPPTTSAFDHSYANCADLHSEHPHGVGRSGAVDHTSGKPVTTFEVNDRLYAANDNLDRDGDGIACE
jgi:hypothetical protein